MGFPGSFFRNLSTIPGWISSRKLVLFMVDDYGSIRMSSKESLESMEKSGLKVRSGRYNRYETIESNSDLELLFNVLSKFRDINGNNPVFTPLVCVANPDFEKIRDSGYKEYFYEPFTETLKRYPEHDRVFDLWKQGIENRIFVPQFHGREHLNIRRWMTDLKDGVKSTHIAFNHGVSGIGPRDASDVKKNYQASFALDRSEDISELGEILDDGLNLFTNLLGYNALYFTPPNGLFNRQLESKLKDHKLDLINIAKVNREPLGGSKYKLSFHYLGQRNRYDQRYLVRNALFEPCNITGPDPVDRCLKDIEVAFRWRKPAIISSHRVNFCGHLDSENRANGLHQLEILLKTIITKWKDVEFVTAETLRNAMFS